MCSIGNEKEITLDWVKVRTLRIMVKQVKIYWNEYIWNISIQFLKIL
jgi:hypothetical protein